MTFATVAFAVLILALVSQIVRILPGRSGTKIFMPLLLPASTILLVIDLVLRSIRISFVAVTNTYEALTFLSAALGAILSWMQFRADRDEKRAKESRYVVFGGSLLMFLFLALASSPLVPNTVRPPVPALRSAWLVMHVSLAFVGEAFFAVSFIAALMGLLSSEPDRRRKMDRLTYTAIAVGYPIFTIGALIFGAIWAQFAWGRYWGWDPKETWALVTWLTYTLYLHLRISGSRRRKLSQVVAAVGFIFTLFTFFGVNYLLSGLHSYG